MPFDAMPQPLRHAAEIAIVDKMTQLLATPDRWCQGSNFNGARMCLVGAAWTVLGGDPGRMPLATPIRRSLQQALDEEAGMSVAIFNDAPERTHADVVDLLVRVRRRFEESL
jgi:hypothetical protein